MLRKRLHHGRIDAYVGIQRLLNVYDKGITAPLRQCQSNHLVPIQHSAAEKPWPVQLIQHPLGQLQLSRCSGIVPLGKLSAVIRPKLVNQRHVRRRQRSEHRVRAGGSEFLDMVALAGIPPSGKGLQIFRFIQIVPPGTHIAHRSVRVALEQPRRFRLGDHRDYRRRSGFHAPVLYGRESRVLVPLRTGNRVVKHHLFLRPVANNQAARGFRESRKEVLPPHQLRPCGIFAQSIIAVFIIPAQKLSMLGGDRRKTQHVLKSFLGLPEVGDSPCKRSVLFRFVHFVNFVTNI
ncbi:hypothetical protein SDC9_90564 [bioreactor metagenome]|uniref:Uncharacterized protein n=1 Tax=bioreactor metagenome TaxID=1076179 RepID=A0A644ZT05_9ZZZZ